MNVLALSQQASLLIAAILLARAVLLHRLPRRTFSLLWGVVALRLLLPFSLPSHLSIFALGRQAMSAAQPIEVGVGASDALALSPLIQGAASHPDSSLTAVWVSGALLCAACLLLGHVRALRRYRTALPVEGESARWLRAHTRRPVSLRSGGGVTTPLTYGVLRPIVLLPTSLLDLDGETLRFVLAHELCHVRRLDVVSRWIYAAALCLHWFNPLVWAFFLFACRDMEIACDEAVVCAQGPGCRAAYARALLELEATRSSPSPLFSGFSKTAIEERIVSIMKLKKLTLSALISALMLGAFITTVFATSAPPAKQPAGLDAPVSAAITSAPALAQEEMLWPADAAQTITLSFGERKHPLTGETTLVDHICISGPDARDSDICAVLSGTVAFAGWAGESGYRIELNHENGLTTVYAHCSQLNVRTGDTVSRGDAIATLGSTGNATGPCLSFGVMQDGVAVDPLSFFPER